MGRLRRSAVDGRFMAFVVATMILSVVTTVAITSLGLLFSGDSEGAGGVLVYGVLGAGFVAGPMLIIGLVPSIPMFLAVFRLAGGERALPQSVEYAGVATAGAASAFWTSLLWYFNGDGAEIIVAATGIPAVLVAAFTARWAYGPSQTSGNRSGSDELLDQ